MEGADVKKHLSDEENFFDEEYIKDTQAGSKINWCWGVWEKEYIFDRIAGNIYGKKLLDLGCGPATSVKYLLNPITYNFSYTGVDISQRMLDFAKTNIPSGKFVKCNIENLPFENESFDFVIGLGVFHHLPSHEQGIKEAFRVLKKGGIFACREPSEKVFRKHGESPHEKGIETTKFIKICENYGEILFFKRINTPLLSKSISLFNRLHVPLPNSRYFWYIKKVADEAMLNHLAKKIKWFEGNDFIFGCQKK